ncbi:hypothetical protein [Streptomyces sp. NPDC021020]|uniref:hypothetical protein n=1 Tax=Streptomyces sp. NPDC021020 TaxID=3365109 RepID=UPI003793475E
MAGTSITVCLPAGAADDVEAAVAEAMAPFEIDHTAGDDRDIWDAWYVSGGTAHGGGFTVLPGREHDSRLLHEIPGRWWRPGSQATPNEFGWCAGGPRGLLDFSASREEAAELAEAAWQRWHELARELPEPRARDVFRARRRTDPGYSREQAAADYRAQPLLRAFEDYLETLPTERYWWGFLRSMDPVTDIGPASLEEFLVRTLPSALNTRNVLTLDGWWHEDGAPGIHGACPSPAACPHTPGVPAGQDHVDAYLLDLPADTLLVNVHCHV